MDTVACFRLGKALRYGDAESFFDVYDSLSLADGRSERQLEEVKEFARLVSELPNEDFSLLQTQVSSPQTPAALPLPPPSSPSEQLASLLDRLRLDVCSSDSGAVSDFDSSVGDKSSVCGGTRSRRSSLMEEESAVACVKDDRETTTLLQPPALEGAGGGNERGMDDRRTILSQPPALELEGPCVENEHGRDKLLQVALPIEGSKTVGVSQSAEKGPLGRNIGNAGGNGCKTVPRAAAEAGGSVGPGRLTQDRNPARGGQTQTQSHCDSLHSARRGKTGRLFRDWDTPPGTGPDHVSNVTHTTGAHVRGRRKARSWRGKRESRRHNQLVCAGTETAWTSHLRVVQFLHSQWLEVHRELHGRANTQTCT